VSEGYHHIHPSIRYVIVAPSEKHDENLLRRIIDETMRV
jgi:hypothetical protein